ncbi:hypothetical protein V8Z80_19650 [Orrella sp. JC864]|uniref:hypothetical protein n=1 Tax=Orrella sp. JC864 TaxID=3120298 RepID=UPI0012BC871A
MRAAAPAALVLALAGALAGAGCAAPPGAAAPDGRTPRTEAMSADQLGQTDFNRTVTIAMRDNLASLDVLLDKFYRRNPSQWRKSGAPDMQTAIRRVQSSMRSGRPPAGLGGLRDIQILAVALDPAYPGDRVAAFVYGLADTLIAAHGGKTRFYATDMLDGQHVFNAARNVEAAAWMLGSRRDPQGQPLLLANEISEQGSNLSFEREFGALIGRLDLIANLLGENTRRVGINYAQGLMFFSFLPVR